jgi:hypothetical protein
MSESNLGEGIEEAEENKSNCWMVFGARPSNMVPVL